MATMHTAYSSMATMHNAYSFSSTSNLSFALSLSHSHQWLIFYYKLYSTIYHDFSPPFSLYSVNPIPLITCRHYFPPLSGPIRFPRSSYKTHATEQENTSTFTWYCIHKNALLILNKMLLNLLNLKYSKY